MGLSGMSEICGWAHVLACAISDLTAYTAVVEKSWHDKTLPAFCLTS